MMNLDGDFWWICRRWRIFVVNKMKQKMKLKVENFSITLFVLAVSYESFIFSGNLLLGNMLKAKWYLINSRSKIDLYGELWLFYYFQSFEAREHDNFQTAKHLKNRIKFLRYIKIGVWHVGYLRFQYVPHQTILKSV